MVRLKASRGDGTGVYYLFQFQYGAIKSGHINTVTVWQQEFQFQYGAIKRKSRLKSPQMD